MADDLQHYVDQVAARAVRDAPAPPETGPMPEPASRDQVRAHLDTAAAHADAGTALAPDTRMRLAKSGMLRVLRLITADQTAYNRNLLAAARHFESALEALEAASDQRLNAMAAALANAELSADDDLDDVRRALAALEEQLEHGAGELARLADGVTEDRRAAAAHRQGYDGRLSGTEEALAAMGQQLEALAANVKSIDARLNVLASERAADHARLTGQDARVEMLLKEARRRLPAEFDDEQLATFAQQLAGRRDPFYSDLEMAFRGAPSDVRRRLEVYLPYVEELAGGQAAVVDIGCGRAEWLELMRDKGVPAYGIELNDSFVSQAQERGLDVRRGDALVHLQEEVEEGSLAAVTAFHIIEHLDFDTQLALLDGALRALRPGGMLIIETPNPNNVAVATSTFHLDPTHRVPLPPDLAYFMFQGRGYVDIEVRELNPPLEPPLVTPEFEGAAGEALVRIVDQLNRAFHVGRDYAVVGRKPR